VIGSAARSHGVTTASAIPSGARGYGVTCGFGDRWSFPSSHRTLATSTHKAAGRRCNAPGPAQEATAPMHETDYAPNGALR